MRILKCVSLLAFCSFVILANCGGYSNSTPSENDDEEATLTATLSSIQSNVFTPKCATSGCHSRATATNGLSLADGDAFSNLVGVASQDVPALSRVAAGSSSTSYLINKIENTQTSVGGSGTRMPQGGTALTQETIDVIKTWIDDGASNN